MAKNFRGEKEKTKEQLLKNEISKLKSEVNNLKSQILKLKEESDSRSKTLKKEDTSQNVEKCIHCDEGFLIIVNYFKQNIPWFYKKCSNCNFRTDSIEKIVK